MDSKAIIIQLIKENKRYWGQMLYQEYFEMFQKIHSNKLLADLITKDLNHTITEKQIDNLKKRMSYSVNAKSSESSNPTPKASNEQDLYNQIYAQKGKSQFDLNNM